MSKIINRLQNQFIAFSVNSPKKILFLMLAITFTILSLAAIPSLWPDKFPYLNHLVVDTDPENMLPHDEPSRVFHDEMKKQMNLHEIVGVGVVNLKHPQGIYNTATLTKVYELTEFAKTLTWQDKEGNPAGVVTIDLMAPSTIDNIEQDGPATVRFDWLMETPPQTAEEIALLKAKVKRLPFVQELMFSDDEKALAISLPITSKDVSYQIYNKLQEKIKTLNGNGDTFHVAGLPVAEDVFGVEMFKQMAVAAPLAMLVIFLLMLIFFRKIVMVVSPLIVAMVSVMITMGLLVITGNTIHIMSSMIPIFIMPIAVLDAVHILSDFFDEYQQSKDRKKTLEHVMGHLFKPMFYTTITTVVGFASLAYTPIPPVQVFGVFVAFGVLMAWIWTILFVPAYIMLLPEKTLENFGAKKVGKNKFNPLNQFLSLSQKFSYYHPWKIVLLALLAVGISIYGINKIIINDNPTRWFEPDHPIRIADKVMNKHLAGTYGTYLVLKGGNDNQGIESFKKVVEKKFPQLGEEPWASLTADAKQTGEWLGELETYIEDKLEESDEDYYEEVLNEIDQYKTRRQIFKDPEVLNYISQLQEHLNSLEVVGKTLSISDLVKTVNREMYNGEEKHYTIPQNAQAIGQHYVTFQSGHRPQDLWHFVTPRYDLTNLWVQLKSGNNIDMQQVVTAVDEFTKKNPPPAGLQTQWFGLTYINLIWQDKMVWGMLKAFLSSFVVVMLMMTFLFRSILWGVLSMIPLSVTILVIYGAIGLMGKEYDIPIAVLSSLSLGLAIDYAIHFIARSMSIYHIKGSWEKSVTTVFDEPAKAITRNVIVVGFGFFPLLLSPLVPYQTVGIFIAAILISAGAVTINLLPALIRIFEKPLFKHHQKNKG